MGRGKSAHASNQIRALHKAVIKKIMGMGYDVWISYAKKTRSRYYEFFVCGHSIKIRLSDHESWKAREFDYDIYVSEPRKNAFGYAEWVKDVEGKIQAIRSQDNERKNTPL